MIEKIGIPLLAILLGLLLFSLFVFTLGKDPFEVLGLIYQGGFGSAFSWQNTLLRAAPLILTGLAVALPAQTGLIMIGAEGTLALGALSAVLLGLSLTSAGFLPPPIITTFALLFGALIGALWMGLTGLMRVKRNMNETIVSLLMSYIAIAVFNHVVEGPARDAASLNKPSTRPVVAEQMIGNLPGMEVHWGLFIGVVLALALQLLMSRSNLGFAMRIAGGNPKAASLVGLPVNKLILLTCLLGGACAGLAGALEVYAIHTSANASLLVGYGYTGILVAFIARQQPALVIPVAILMGGISAAGSLLQRRVDLPDATTLVLQGFLFLAIIASESLYGRRFAKSSPALPDPAIATVAARAEAKA